MYSAWKHGGRKALCLLHHGYQAWLAGCKAPHEWFSSVLVTPVKGDKLHPKASDLRPRCLENSAHKVHATMLNRRLLERMPQWCFPRQRGFVPGRRLEHNLLDLEYSLMRCARKGARAGVFLSDFSAAFPSISQEFLLRTLAEHGAPADVFNAVRSSYQVG
eukprot:6457031-Amphidinium_carterae.1